jgi:hypothetical protein
MTDMGFQISDGGAPPDDVPDDVTATNTGPSNWFDPEYPHSTAEHPYGYFPLSDGSPDYSRPRKRRPHKRGGGSGGVTVGRMPASESQARTAAALLARANLFLGMGLAVFGLHLTVEMLKDANKEFEVMAYEALLNDPALCRKILAAGATSGKAQLMMAYALLGGSLAPVAYTEFRANRPGDVVDETGEDIRDGNVA